MKKFTILTILTTILTTIFASYAYGVEPVTRVTTTPKVIGTNETAIISVDIINCELTSTPVLSKASKDFDLQFLGPQKSHETRIINGSVSVRETYSYMFRLIPKSTGNITIPAFIGQTKLGKEIYTESSSIEIQKIDSLRASHQNIFRGLNSFFNSDPGTPFLQWRLSSAETIQNTYIIADLYIFSQNPNFLDHLNYLKMQQRPGFDGGVLYEIDSPPNPETIVENFGFLSKFYGRHFKSYLIFPLEKGELRLNPPLFIYDNPPFSTYVNGENILIKSIPTTKNLTYIGKTLDIEMTLSSTNINVSEEAVMTLRISGNGNTDFFANPFKDVQINNLFISDPDTKIQISQEDNNNFTMIKEFTYTIIPRAEGSFTIPSVKLNYSTPQGVSKEIVSEELTLTAQAVQNTNHFSNNLPILSEKSRTINYSSGWLFILFSILSGSIIIAVGYSIMLKNNRLLSDHKFSRFSGAKTRIEQALSESITALEKKDYRSAARLLRQGILNFCTDKFSLPVSSSPQEIITFFKQKGITFSLEEEFLALTKRLEFCAFTNNPNAEILQSELEKAKLVIEAVNRLKR
ncbi:MAG: BatD family protein [Brevinemataceae bacterium]